MFSLWSWRSNGILIARTQAETGGDFPWCTVASAWPAVPALLTSKLPFLALLIRGKGGKHSLWQIFLPIFSPVFEVPNHVRHPPTHIGTHRKLFRKILIWCFTEHRRVGSGRSDKVGVLSDCTQQFIKSWLHGSSRGRCRLRLHTCTQACSVLSRKMDRSTDCKWHVNFFCITHGQGVRYQSKGTRAPAIKAFLFFFPLSSHPGAFQAWLCARRCLIYLSTHPSPSKPFDLSLCSTSYYCFHVPKVKLHV